MDGCICELAKITWCLNGMALSREHSSAKAQTVPADSVNTYPKSYI